MLRPDRTNPVRFAPDLLADRDIALINRQFPAWTALSLVAPAVVGGLISWSWWGAATAFFWAGLVRVGVLHHVTWSVNSICHMIGERPWTSKDRSTNFWPLAIVSFGESWHNLHHADPTCARHGVGRGQIDISGPDHRDSRALWMGVRHPLAHTAAGRPPGRVPRQAGLMTHAPQGSTAHREETGPDEPGLDRPPDLIA